MSDTSITVIYYAMSLTNTPTTTHLHDTPTNTCLLHTYKTYVQGFRFNV